MKNLPEGVEIRSNSIRINFTYRGKRCRETLKGWKITPTNIKKAGRLRASIVEDISCGKFDYIEIFPNSPKAQQFASPAGIGALMTVNQLTRRWLATKKLIVTPASYRSQMVAVDTCEEILGADRLIHSIQYPDVLTLRNELLSGVTRYKTRINLPGRSVKTVNTYMSIMLGVWKFALKCGFVQSNLFKEVPPLKIDNKEPDPLEKEELERLINCRGIHPQDRNLWELAVYTGLRQGELCALAWEDIDLERGTMTICRNLASTGGFKVTKSQASMRTIELLDPAIESLKKQKELTYHRVPQKVQVALFEKGMIRTDSCRWVFVKKRLIHRGNTEKTYLSSSSIRDTWNLCVTRAGIRRRNPYQTRHTFACWMLTNGANPSFIAQQMGHKDTMMLMNIYGKFMSSSSRTEVERLNTAFRDCPTSVPSQK